MPRTRPDMSARLDEAGPSAPGASTRRGREAFSAVPPASGPGQMEVSVELIDPAPTNPRSTLGELEGLADSIREQGVICPLLVRPAGDRYQLIYGHRRLAAAQLAGRTTVPVFFDTGDADEACDQARRLVENLHREDLSPLDEARAFQQLIDLRVTAGQQGVAKMVGKSQGHVSKRLGLLRLPEDIREGVYSGGITATDAGELAKLADQPEHLRQALKQAGWSGGITSSVRRELQEIERAKQRVAMADQLRATGMTVLEDIPTYDRQDGPCPLMWLGGVDAGEHAKLSCHAAVISEHFEHALPMCLNPRAHEHIEDPRAAEFARQTAERTERETALETAAQSRRQFARSLIQANQEAGPAVLMAQLLTSEDRYVELDTELTVELLDIHPDTFDDQSRREAIAAYVAKGSRNVQRAAYAAGLALGESAMTGYQAWGRRAYCDHLVGAGYHLTDMDTALLAEEADDCNEDEDVGDLDDPTVGSQL